jgi:hypothetical protein
MLNPAFSREQHCIIVFSCLQEHDMPAATLQRLDGTRQLHHQLQNDTHERYKQVSKQAGLARELHCCQSHVSAVMHPHEKHKQLLCSFTSSSSC